jgi:PEP-CTERM motif
MSFSGKASACAAGCAAISLIAFPASARAEALFDSLNSPNTGVAEFTFFPDDASFATGASTFHATDVALLLNQFGGSPIPGDNFTVSLAGGVPLADVTFLGPVLGLNVFPNQGPVLGSVTLPISDLSTSLTVEHFSQFASVALKPDSFYWIDVNISPQAANETEPVGVGWGVTSDNAGIGVAAGYNSSDATDFFFFPNNGAGGGPAFQMEVSAPEPSTWALMLAGFGALALIAYRRRPGFAFRGA